VVAAAFKEQMHRRLLEDFARRRAR